jgi:hypothetical protein
MATMSGAADEEARREVGEDAEPEHDIEGFKQQAPLRE